MSAQASLRRLTTRPVARRDASHRRLSWTNADLALLNRRQPVCSLLRTLSCCLQDYCKPMGPCVLSRGMLCPAQTMKMISAVVRGWRCAARSRARSVLSSTCSGPLSSHVTLASGADWWTPASSLAAVCNPSHGSRRWSFGRDCNSQAAVRSLLTGPRGSALTVGPLVSRASCADPSAHSRDDQGRWEASVKINSQAVPIYKVEHKEEKTTCYIEAVEDAEFTVTFMKAKMTATDLAAWLKVDGTRVDGFSIPIDDMGGHVDTFEGARISATAIRPFKFAKIALTDEPDMASTSEQVVKNLGTIQIAICRTQILGKSLVSAAYSDYKQHVVDEKSKKATMSHSTSCASLHP